MDIVPRTDLPGASFGFRDVRSVFEDAAADMNDDQMLFMDGFSLQDAMAAFEIGEPRLDSGYIPTGEVGHKFNPLVPLLPEELCWVIDRAFSYEMEWHSGNFMSHTVLTLLYTRHLDSIDPDLIQKPLLFLQDPQRPLELITIVLRASVAGLLKCCDLTWRELSKGAVQDTEDWQSDKCEIYLLESTPVRVVTSMLEEASLWVTNSLKVPPQWKDALISRLQLRKASSFIHRDFPINGTPGYISICEELLRQLSLHSIPEPYPDSVARLAFDPYVSKRLDTAVPIRVLSIGSAGETWRVFSLFLKGLKETSQLAASHNLATWKVIGTLRVWTGKSPIQQPYIRSLTQSVFYDGLLVLDNYPCVWLVDQLFFETIGVTWSYFQSQVSRQWVGFSAPSFDLLERKIYKLMITHIRGSWSNPPRRRRQLMKILVGWHHIYDALLEMMSHVDLSDLAESSLLSGVPRAILLWRLSAIQEIVFSGFQLQLYAPEERNLAYWYLTQLFELELECYDALLPSIPQSSLAFREMLYNQQVATALQSLCSSSFIMTLSLLSFNWDRTRPNFFRRYKWAFKPDYEKFDTIPVGHPDFVKFMRACLGTLKDETVSPREGIEFAARLLKDLIMNQDGVETGYATPSRLGAWADGWIGERRQFIEGLISIADNLSSTLDSNPQSFSLTLSSLSFPDPQSPSSSMSTLASTSTRSSIAKSTTISTTIVLDLRAEYETEVERKFHRSSNAPEDDGEDLRDGGRISKRVTSREIRLHWDPNIHPWFPVPCDDSMDMR
ncbi:N-alpha-acetyltransferase, non-catalitic subunit [Leucoagaricus gongylophorus]